jgi:hypothetical protein
MLPLNPKFFDEHAWVLFNSIIFLLISGQRFSGMYALVFCPFLIIWLIYSIFIVYTRPLRRKSQLIKVGIWFFAIFVVVGIHVYRSDVARRSGDEVVLAINKYRLKNGAYPANLDTIGQDTQRLRRELMLRYWLLDGTPTLAYASTISPLDRYFYNFDKSVWEFHPD